MTERNENNGPSESLERERPESADYKEGLWILHVRDRDMNPEKRIMYGMPNQDSTGQLYDYYIHGGYRAIDIPGLGAIRVAESKSSWEWVPSRPATLDEAIRLVEAMGVSVEENHWNDLPNELKRYPRGSNRIEAIRGKAIADCALELVKGVASTDPNVTKDQIERLEMAERRMSDPKGQSSNIVEDPTVIATSDEKPLGAHLRRPQTRDYISGNRRSLANPSGR